MPYTGRPVTRSAAPICRRGVPRIDQLFGSLSLISRGGPIFEAAAANWPKLAVRPLGAWAITPFAATHSVAETFPLRAAAPISISLAAAPACRRYSWDVLTDWLEPVSMLPQTPLRLRFSWGG